MTKRACVGVIPVLLSRHLSAYFFVIRVAPFLSSQCVTLGSRRLNFNQIIKARSQCLGTGMTKKGALA
ncbi:hypothetical protein [Wolbachia endosymbiont of Aedes albopictus]|uniref:hypothetical protein n=1 Tax=Wolbachia endosymbiont of Aedes albopictus TaxID=167957 RepID=UPI00216902C1|nr:hypothetical protein [Wolbachia endosymbiont of Aedes albopictus]UVW83582.1 hypothetical protein NHG98_04360 [Wolbachia endosymbiont of Aedes albopictus]